VGKTWFALKRLGRRKLADIGSDLTLEQLMIMHQLLDQDGIRIRDLADCADRDRTTTSRMIDGLEKRGMVVRVPDRQDARQKLVYLTRTARERLDEMSKLREEIFGDMYQQVGMENIALATETLLKVADNLEKK
jgi:DNA-binding MarR family transcriptional regulator